MTPIDRRADELFASHLRSIHRRTDVVFGVLLVLQYVAAITAALVISPRAWSGAASQVHIHVWAAIVLGGLFTALPLVFIVTLRGARITRYTVAVAQMLFSCLLIHLTGGRIETHFHIFGSLAFLAFYRDWTVLVPATLVVLADHILRGYFWPQSVFGVLAAAPWRAFEHAGWVLFEDVFLAYACVRGVKELRTIAASQARLEAERESTEHTVLERTRELERQRGALHASEARYQRAVAGSNDGLWDWDLTSETVYYAPRWAELLGVAFGSLSDSPDEWISRIAPERVDDFRDALARHLDGLSDRFDIEIEMVHADGSRRWMLCRSAAIRDSAGRATRLSGSISDISALKRAQHDLKRLAQQDPLTGLSNRVMILDTLRAMLDASRADASRSFAALYLDFDRFKVINDGLGHSIGDALLRSVADRLRAALRARDVAARLGGDEFLVLLSGVDREETERRCAAIMRALEKPHLLEGHEVSMSASIGIVTSDLAHADAEDIIRDADAAMYQAKLAGRAQFRFFDAAMHAQALERVTLEQDLRRANLESEFRVLYQPIVALASGRVVGFEALLRWEHPTRGMLSPDAFIPIAEETGLIIHMGEWIFRQGCAQMRAWMDEFGDSHAIKLNINLSRRQLSHPGLLDMLTQIASGAGVPPSRLRLEITETTVMDSRADVVSVMQSMRDAGFGLAMDDFGTGHSSLSCLHRFPIDVLKIDRSFISNLAGRRELSAVMHAIVTLAHHLGLSVVAEGVETGDQLAQLQAMECECAQGYLFDRPLTAARATESLREDARRRSRAA